MPNKPTEASLVDINAITQIASVRRIKTSEAKGVASLDTAQTFGTLPSFSTGISATALTVGGGGATFASNASFSSTTNHLGLATFAGGITSSSLWIGGGATFSGDIAVNGGDITTTSATATLYNTTATTVDIGNAAGTVSVMGGTASPRLNIGSSSYVKTGRIDTTTTAKQEIFRYTSVAFSNFDTYFADIIITANYGGGIAGSVGSQITKMLVATSYNTTINHTEYGNVNTGGNLAAYTAELSGDNVIIYATPTNTNSTAFSVYATLIKGTYGANTEE